MLWATAISQAMRIEDAVDEALDTISADLQGQEPDLVAAFVSPDYLSHASRLPPHVKDRYPGAALVGCSASGVIAGNMEIEHHRALSIAAAVLPDVTVSPFHLDADPMTWRDSLSTAPEDVQAFILLPDPLTCPAGELVSWLDRRYPSSTTIGGLASGGSVPGSMALFAGDVTARDGAVGVALSGNIAVDTIVAQGCRPIGSPLFATRVEGNTVLELDGQPAVQVLESLYTELGPHDQQLFGHSLFLGLVMTPHREHYRQGDFLIRNIVGVEPDLGAIMATASLLENQVVQFHLRDADTSAADLEHLLAAHEGGTPRGALLFSCVGRGIGLYGQAGHDSELFRQRFGDAPVAGFFCNGEIGPVGGTSYLHGYTSSFGLFRQREPTS